MAQKKGNDFGTGATEVKPAVNREIERAKKAAEKKELAEQRAKEKQAAAVKAARLEMKRRSGKKPTNVILEYGGQSFNYRTLVDRARDIWRYDHKGKLSDILSLDLYVKPEDHRVYYVINGDTAGDFPL